MKTNHSVPGTAPTDDQQVVPTGRDALLRVHIIATFIAWCMVATQIDAQIQQAWVARYNNAMTNGTNQPVKMLLDSAGNIYVTGFSENANTNLGYGTIKYAANGTQLWAERYDSNIFPN